MCVCVDFFYSVAWEWVKRAEMHSQGISLVHQYNEGKDVDFDIGLYFYEQICKFLDDPKNIKWKTNYSKSQPTMMTALTRKQELREKVDVNFDGRVSFLEYLLYQYQDSGCNPADFVKRSMGHDEHPEIRKARLALEEVNKRIQAYEAEKSRLESEATHDGVRGLKAKNLLAQLDVSPLSEELRKALITAEAAVRIASKKFGSGGGGSGGSGGEGGADGAIWWMNRDLEEKQRRYGKK